MRQISGTRTRLLCLSLSIVATACISLLPNSAIAGTPSSPFAGCYADGSITISKGGRISGAWDDLDTSISLSGRIWNDGYLELTWKYTTYHSGWDLLPGGDRGPNHTSTTVEYVGFGALDEHGNLYGELMETYFGSTSEFFWPRCE